MNSKRIVIAGVSILLGAMAAFVFNFFFLEKIIIPDPCYYHSHDTSPAFDVFYCFPGSEGGHPFPTTFNVVLTLITGAVLGGLFARLVLWRFLKK